MIDIIFKMQDDIRLREMSESTAVTYLRQAGHYLSFLGEAPVKATAEEDIRRYLMYLRDERQLSVGTINGYSSAVVFLYEVTLNWQLNRKQVPRCKLPKKLPLILPRSTLAEMLNNTDKLQHRTVLSLGYGSGLRASEIGRIKTEDIDSRNMRLFIRQGKGKKDRYTILSKTSLHLLREYWKVYRPDHPEGYLILGRKSKSPLSRNTCAAIFKASVKRAGLDPGKYSFHTLRRSFATHMLEDGTNLLVLKELLGHASLSSTTVYLHLANVSKNLSCPIDKVGVL